MRTLLGTRSDPVFGDRLDCVFYLCFGDARANIASNVNANMWSRIARSCCCRTRGAQPG
jgi:hypothetical protein